MAATLSADEEQVGPESLCAYTFFFLSVFDRPELSQPQPYLEVFGPVHCVCAPLRVAMAVRNGGFVAKWSASAESGNIVSISGALLLELHHCQFLSSVELNCCERGRARLRQPPHRCRVLYNAWLAVAHSWVQTGMLHLGKVVLEEIWRQAALRSVQ